MRKPRAPKIKADSECPCRQPFIRVLYKGSFPRAFLYTALLKDSRKGAPLKDSIKGVPPKDFSKCPCIHTDCVYLGLKYILHGHIDLRVRW